MPVNKGLIIWFFMDDLIKSQQFQIYLLFSHWMSKKMWDIFFLFIGYSKGSSAHFFNFHLLSHLSIYYISVKNSYPLADHFRTCSSTPASSKYQQSELWRVHFNIWRWGTICGQPHQSCSLLPISSWQFLQLQQKRRRNSLTYYFLII